MAILASALTYLGAATGVALALFMSLCAFVSAPDHPTLTQPLAVAAKPSVAKAAIAAAPSAATAAVVGQTVVYASPEGRLALQMKAAAYAHRSAHMRQALRDQYRDWSDRHDHARRWAYQEVPDFNSRYLGYVDAPSVDRTLIR